MPAEQTEEWPCQPDDGHQHEFTDDFDGLPDTGTDAYTVMCRKCGALSAVDPGEE